MCLLTQRTIGVKGLCGPNETFKYYLEDLNGITYQNYAKVATASKTASSLFTQAIDYAIQSTMSDILFTTPSPIQLNSISNVYYHRDFSETVLPVFIGQRGLEVTINHPTQIQYSSPIIRRVYIKTATDAVDLAININVNGVVVRTEIIPIVTAGQTYTIELNETITQRNFSVTFDQTVIETYQALYNTQYQCCGSVSNYTNGFDYLLNRTLGKFRVTGGFGISADIDLACDQDKLTCTLLPYFGEEIRFKAGVYLANEVLVSDRLELFVMNNKEDILEVAKSWQKEYNGRLKRKVPAILNSLKSTDACCFKQLGISRGIQLV